MKAPKKIRVSESASWPLIPLKRYCKIFGRIGFRGYTINDIVEEGDGALSLSPGNIYNDQLTYSSKTFISWEKYDESPEIKVQVGDILFVKTGSTIGKVAYVDTMGEPMTVNPQLVVLKELDLYPKYLYYSLCSKFSKEQVASTNAGGATPALSQEELGLISINVPPTTELQTLIARYLDQKTSQIDALIEQKEKLLKLLTEKRTAIITQAVTKGLDPDVEMKDSGIDWLGEIPKEWEVKKVKFLTNKVKTGTTPSSNGPDYFTDGEIYWYNPGDFNYDSVELADAKRKIQKQFFEDSNVAKYPEGSVLIVGIGATLGKVAVSKLTSYSNQQINAIYPTPKFDSYYLAYTLSSLVEVLKVYSNATTLGIMNQDKTKNFTIPYPEKKEQERIVAYIDKVDKETVKILTKTKSSIGKLKEYREALITSAVTGQIDVRKEVTDE